MELPDDEGFGQFSGVGRVPNILKVLGGIAPRLLSQYLFPTRVLFQKLGQIVPRGEMTLDGNCQSYFSG